MLLLVLFILVTENLFLVKNDKIESQDIINSTNFKNLIAKELLKKKLLNLESARQQDTLAQFLKKGENNQVKVKPNFKVDDDPSRKQAQMANSFIASSNLLFGTKSQRKSCNPTNKPTSKETVLDMQSLRQTFSGYNEEGYDFPSSKVVSNSTVIKRSSKKAPQDPISCYLTEPKKVTCMHRDVIYKIQLPSSDVEDDEIGRIVESIYKAVESSRASVGKGATDDSYKKKRSSDAYIKSLLLNNLLLSGQPKTVLVPSYNGNNAIYLPLIIPVSKSKLEAAYYPHLLTDTKLQQLYNTSTNGNSLNDIGALGKNVLVENGQYIIPEYLLSASNVRPRSEINMTAEEEKKRNWLALMATNGYVQIDSKMKSKLREDGVQSLSEDEGSDKVKVAETSELDGKLHDKRQERDVYCLRRQLRKNENPIILNHTEWVKESDTLGGIKNHNNSDMIQNMAEASVESRGKAPPCHCSSSCPTKPQCTTCKITPPKCTTCTSRCPNRCPTPCPLPLPTRCPKPCNLPSPCAASCPPLYSTLCPKCDSQAKSHDAANNEPNVTTQYEHQYNTNAPNQQCPNNPNFADMNPNESHQCGLFCKNIAHSEKGSINTGTDSRSKIHRATFLSKLRGKFHKTAYTNGTGNIHNSFENRMHSKLHPIVRFNKGPSGQVWQVSHESIASPLKLGLYTSTTPQSTLTTPNHTKTFINQPNQPNQPIIPITSPQTPSKQTPLNHTQTTGFQCQSSVNQPAPQSSHLPPCSQAAPQCSQSVPQGTQAPPQCSQPQTHGSQPSPQWSPLPQSTQTFSPACQPSSSQPTVTQTTTQHNTASTHTTHIQPTHSSTPIPYEETSNNQNLGENMIPPTQGWQVSQATESHPQSLFYREYHSDLDGRLLQVQTNRFSPQVQPKFQNEIPPKEINFDMTSTNQPIAYVPQVLQQGPYAIPIRMQPIMPSPNYPIIPMGRTISRKFENWNHNERQPRTSFKLGKNHKTVAKNDNASAAGSREITKVKWPLNHSSIYDKIARVRRYLQNLERKREPKL